LLCKMALTFFNLNRASLLAIAQALFKRSGA
jgi:hypothetical protein